MGEGDVVVGTAVRCRESLRGAAASLERAAALAAEGEGEELVAAEMRAALDALGQGRRRGLYRRSPGPDLQPVLHWEITP